MLIISAGADAGTQAVLDAGSTQPNPEPTPTTSLAIRAPASQALSVAAGGQVTVTLTLHATGPQTAGRQVFLHAVSAQQPKWF